MKNIVAYQAFVITFDSTLYIQLLFWVDATDARSSFFDIILFFSKRRFEGARNGCIVAVIIFFFVVQLKIIGPGVLFSSKFY